MASLDRGIQVGYPGRAVKSVLTEAADLLGAVERAVAGGGCVHRNGVATAPMYALERFRHRQLARLAGEADPDLRAALWVVQLCGLSEDKLHTVDLDALRAEVPPTSQIWASAARLVSPSLVCSLAVGSEHGARYLDEMMSRHPDRDLRVSLLVDAALAAIERHDRQRVRALLAQLEALEVDTPDVDLVRCRLLRFEGLAPGATAPPFEVPPLDHGRGPLTLQQFRGRFLLLHFWGTWCISCIEELADLRSAFERYSTAGQLELLSVADDDSAQQVRSFLAEHHDLMPWHHALAGHVGGGIGIRDAYAVDTLPWLVLISPEQKIVAEAGDVLRGSALLQTLADVVPVQG